MSLRARREPTHDAEHQLAVFQAETRLGRKLSAGEKRIDIVGMDRDLKTGKADLAAAVRDEQRRAAEEWAATGHFHLQVTDAMMQAVEDLYDAGVEHAERELKAAGIE